MYSSSNNKKNKSQTALHIYITVMINDQNILFPFWIMVKFYYKQQEVDQFTSFFCSQNNINNNSVQRRVALLWWSFSAANLTVHFSWSRPTWLLVGRVVIVHCWNVARQKRPLEWHGPNVWVRAPSLCDQQASYVVHTFVVVLQLHTVET